MTVSPRGVVLCGDSAGGGLALAQALHYRDRGLPLPGRIVLFASWVDLTMSNPGVTVVEDKDVMRALTGLIQAGLWVDKHHKRVRAASGNVPSVNSRGEITYKAGSAPK